MFRKLLIVGTLAAGGVWLQRQMREPGGSRRLSTATESIDVDVPLRTAYNQWTQFEDFPKFMAGVLEVRQLDATHLHWRAQIAGKEEQWEAEITEQIPDRLIAWRSTSGVPNEGAVTFSRIADDRTRIELRILYQPQGFVETVGDAMGAVTLRAKGNLQRFKTFLEARGKETGAWRGTVSGDVTGTSDNRMATNP